MDKPAKPKCFIIMPISTPDSAKLNYNGDGDHFEHVLDHLFMPAVKLAGFDPVPPNAKGSNIIQAEIVKSLETADMVLCDMSCLNPNVFFELGVRTAIDKPVCLVKDSSTPTTPFDTSIIHYHTYNSGLFPWMLQTEIEGLCEHVKNTVVESSGQNSMWKIFGLTTRAELVQPKDAVEARLALISSQVDGLARAIDAQIELQRFHAAQRNIASHPGGLLDYLSANEPSTLARAAMSVATPAWWEEALKSGAIRPPISTVKAKPDDSPPSPAGDHPPKTKEP